VQGSSEELSAIRCRIRYPVLQVHLTPLILYYPVSRVGSQRAYVGHGTRHFYLHYSDTKYTVALPSTSLYNYFTLYFGKTREQNPAKLQIVSAVDFRDCAVPERIHLNFHPEGIGCYSTIRCRLTFHFEP